MAERVIETAKKTESGHKCSSSCKQKPGVDSSGSFADRILHLQRTAGNQAVQNLIKSGTLQAKLKIGQPNDIYEQEADRVAEHVMSMPEPMVRRQPEEEEEEEPVQTKVLAPEITPQLQRQAEEEDEEKEELLQTKEMSGQNAETTPDLESRINAIRGGGQPLSGSERRFFEPRFGHDFSHVRVHTDAQAAEAARAVNARAFTIGQNIVFGSDQYPPASGYLDTLLAHELTHVVQQTTAAGQWPASAVIVQRQARTVAPPSNVLKPPGTSAVELLPIQEVRKFFRRGGAATVRDVDTGRSYKVRARSVDASHADVYPETASDTAILKTNYGFAGEFVGWCGGKSAKLWTRRPIVVTVDGDPKGRKIAASQHGCPHEYGKSGAYNFKPGKRLKDHKEDNNYPGHFCIHFHHSKTHKGGKEDSQHQQMVKKAAGFSPRKQKVTSVIKRHGPRRIGKGYAMYGGGRLSDKLRALRDAKKLAVSDDEIGLLQAVAEVESGGLVQCINTWDSDVVSFGFKQYTLAGRLQQLILKVPGTFARYGIKLDGTLLMESKGKKVTGIQGAANESELRDLPWATKFFQAGLDDEIIIAQVVMAKEDLAAMGRKLRTYSKQSEMIDRARIRAIIFELRNNRPAYVAPVIERTLHRIENRMIVDECEFSRILCKEIEQKYVDRNEVKIHGRIRKVNGKTEKECREKARRICKKTTRIFGPCPSRPGDWILPGDDRKVA